MKSRGAATILAVTLSLLLGATATLALQPAPGGEEQGQTKIQAYIRAASLQNGSSIYYYGVNRWGQRIPFAGGPRWMYMRGGGCLQCHGPYGQGGIVPMMCNVMTPAITYQALTEAEPEKAGEKAPAYTIRTIQEAIEQGVDEEGKPLDWCMPRWGLSPIDFRDLLAFLYDLGKGRK